MKRKSSEKNKVFVLDTSALFALRDDENGADQVESILRKGEKGRADIYVSFMTLLEVYYIVWRREGKEAAHYAYLETNMLPIEVVNIRESMLLQAGFIKANYTLSVADSFIIATAVDKEGILVHKDPEFEQVSDIVQLNSLPYK